MRQDVARISRSRGIDSYVAFVYVLDYSVLVDHERRAVAIATLFIEDAIILDDSAFEIAQQRESYAILFGKLTVGRNAVYAETENLCVRRFEFGETSLVRLHLRRSTTGKSQHIEGEYDILLALEVAKFVPH